MLHGIGGDSEYYYCTMCQCNTNPQPSSPNQNTFCCVLTYLSVGTQLGRLCGVNVIGGHQGMGVIQSGGGVWFGSNEYKHKICRCNIISHPYSKSAQHNKIFTMNHFLHTASTFMRFQFGGWRWKWWECGEQPCCRTAPGEMCQCSTTAMPSACLTTSILLFDV